jgi:hypothetical protein
LSPAHHAVLEKLLPVVPSENHDRILEQTTSLQFFKKMSELLVEFRDRPIVGIALDLGVGHQPSRLGRFGQEIRHGVVVSSFWPEYSVEGCLGEVGDVGVVVVEEGEEWSILKTIKPFEESSGHILGTFATQQLHIASESS